MSHFKLIIIIGLAISLAMPYSGFGQFRDSYPGSETRDYLNTPQDLGVKSFSGLLDPSRMQMSHEMSMGYISTQGISVSRGLYLNHMKYQISRPLSLTTHLGYQFQPHGPSEWNPANTGQEFVGGADLDWKPSRNSIIRLSVYRGMYPATYYGRGMGYTYDPMPYGYHFTDRP
jgi:hypothetical protein